MPIPVVERSEREIARRIGRKIGGMDQVAECNEVTMGFTRKKPNVHFHARLRGNPEFEETHKICSQMELEVRNLVPNARVVIHSTTSGTGDPKEVWKTVKNTADAEPGSRGVQNIHLRKMDGGLGVDFHLQVGTLVTPTQAQNLLAQIEKKVKATDPRITDLVIHRGSIPELISSEQAGYGSEIRSYLDHVVERFPDAKQVRPPSIQMAGDRFSIIFRMAVPSGASKASQIASEFEAAIKSGYSAIARVDIREED
jgi:divalent metal cation (Fe/Co/Zn/Cd) transporter